MNERINNRQIGAALDSLEAIGPMSNSIDEWDRESTNAVARAFGYSDSDANRLWRGWRDQDLIQLVSDHHGEPGLKIDSRWSWKQVPKLGLL